MTIWKYGEVGHHKMQVSIKELFDNKMVFGLSKPLN